MSSGKQQECMTYEHNGVQHHGLDFYLEDLLHCTEKTGKHDRSLTMQ